MKESYLGVHVSPLTYDKIINDLSGRIADGQQSTIIAINPEKVMAAQQDADLKSLINSSTYQIPDGIGILLASKIKRGKISERVTGVDMMERLLMFASLQGHPVYFYGAKEEVVKLAMSNIIGRFPGIQIAGYTNGYEQDEEALIERINESNARFIFVALGSPKQELWIQRNMARLPGVKVFQGVGGSFDVFSGTVKRAPLIFRKFGIEWLYRLGASPSRLKRQINLPVFLYKVLRSR